MKKSWKNTFFLSNLQANNGELDRAVTVIHAFDLVSFLLEAAPSKRHRNGQQTTECKCPFNAH